MISWKELYKTHTHPFAFFISAALFHGFPTWKQNWKKKTKTSQTQTKQLELICKSRKASNGKLCSVIRVRYGKTKITSVERRTENSEFILISYRNKSNNNFPQIREILSKRHLLGVVCGLLFIPTPALNAEIEMCRAGSCHPLIQHP